MIVCNKCGWCGNRSELITFYNGLKSAGAKEEYCCPNCGAQDYKDMRI